MIPYIHYIRMNERCDYFCQVNFLIHVRIQRLMQFEALVTIIIKLVAYEMKRGYGDMVV